MSSDREVAYYNVYCPEGHDITHRVPPTDERRAWECIDCGVVVEYDASDFFYRPIHKREPYQCRGSYALGSACGRCPRCKEELAGLLDDAAKWHELKGAASALRDANQPDPTGDGAEVWPLVLDDLDKMVGRRLIHEQLAAALEADIRQRDALGRERYGTPLRLHNGRDALRDLYEETMDGAVYARQASAEHPDDKDLAHLSSRAIWLMAEVRAVMYGRAERREGGGHVED